MGTVALWAKRRVSVCHEDTGGWTVYLREGDCAAENVRGEIEKQKSGNEETSGVVVLRSRKSVWYTRLPVCVERQIVCQCRPRVGETPKMRMRERD